MTNLVVRRLLVDMEAPIARHWCGDDAFRSAFFNALSMSFPCGEQFFIDSVRGGFKALPDDARHRFESEVQGFVGQEATHRRLHGLYNDHLERLGLINEWGPRATQAQKPFDGADPRHSLAVTAAYEHFTAIFANWLLGHSAALSGAEERLTRLWQWHCAEEMEHRNTAFDLYWALGGDHAWRVRWFRRISLVFSVELFRQTVLNLRHDGTLLRWSTWKSGAIFLFGKQGLIRQTWRPWRDYFHRDFHPAHHDASASRAWLESNRDAYVAIQGPRR